MVRESKEIAEEADGMDGVGNDERFSSATKNIPGPQRPVTGGLNLRWCCLVGAGLVVEGDLTLSKTQPHEIFFWQIFRIKLSPNYLRLNITTPRNGKRAESGKSLCST